MKRLFRCSTLSTTVLLSILAGCAGPTKPVSEPRQASPTDQTGSSATEDSTVPGKPASPDPSSNDASPPTQPKEPEGPPPRERVRIENTCAKPVNLRLERNNDSDLNTSIGSNTSMEERAKDGDEVIIVDAKYAPITKIIVTAQMKAVVIQSGCVTIGSR